jgi:hypothetical protein
MKTIENLLTHSGLPGPRANLSLLYSFAKIATEKEIKECLSFYRDDLHNSPEEFVVVCGIVGYCFLNRHDIGGTLHRLRPYASHSSWRIREAVAIGIQEIAVGNMDRIIEGLSDWMNGNAFEKRALVASLCEPKLLKEELYNLKILSYLDRLTREFEKIPDKLDDKQESLRKTLGYGWSVLIIHLPVHGRSAFEKMAVSDNRNIQWIIRENLKKKRLEILDKNWVNKMKIVP